MTYQQQLDWLVTMASNPGAKAHAWHRAKELAADKSGLWLDIDKRLTEAMKEAEPANADPRA